MIKEGKTIISDDLKEEMFYCDLRKCKGACCVEGDLGAPLEDEELEVLERIYDQVKPYLRLEGIKAIEKQGKYIFDEEKEFSTPTIGGRECAYATYDRNGVLKCGIERAWSDGKTNFRKPISCHLYPVRITRYDDYDAINYDRWEICSPACGLGKALKMPLYKFIREALIRKYGEQWYRNLEKKIKTGSLNS